MPSDLPLGIFDSGVGGLTVVNAVQKILPRESIIYFGDTARVPYGNKSPDTVLHLSEEICQFLLHKNVKAIVVACNTASAHALPELQEKFQIPIFGMIQPGVESALQATRTGRIGIVGTVGTIRSMAYQNALKTVREKIHIVAQATPLLVPLIEENYLNHTATRTILDEYLENMRGEKIDTLVKACTHYPLLSPLFAELLGENVVLVDPADACAYSLRDYLQMVDQLNNSNKLSTVDVFLTDLPLHFATLAKRFFNQEITSIQLVNLFEERHDKTRKFSSNLSSMEQTNRFTIYS